MRSERARRGAVSPRVAAGVAIVALLGLLLMGLVPRLAARRVMRADAAAAAAPPPVFVASARRGAPSSLLSLPGTVQAMHEAQLYARTSGYVKRWYADIGARVKAGQLLAELESPELAQELAQANAAAAQSRATATFARTSLERWKTLEQDSAVSLQELDEKTAAAEASAAAAAAAEANARRLAALEQYTRIVAPYGGVVTARGVDVGTLVQPGTSAAAPVPGSSRGLFAVAQMDTVRVYVNVPEAYAASVRAGGRAEVRSGSAPGRVFAGRVARTAGAVDPASRTLLAEVAVPNRDGALLPGSSATVSFTLERATPPVLVPANTLLIGTKGPKVAIVAADTVALAAVELGRDYGDSVEVLGGVQAGQVLVVNPGDDLLAGSRVTVAKPAAPAAAKKP